MKKGTIIWAGVAAAATVPLFLYLRPTAPRGVTAVTPFDKDKYLGTWYEIARFDYFFERRLQNVTANYSMNSDGTIKVINRGYDPSRDMWKESVGKAKFAGDPSVAALKVSFFGPIYAGYNVIALDTYYKYALVAGRNFNYLWFLSREKTMPESIRLSYLNEASKLGYDVSKLIWVKQDTIGEIP